ncbi:MULTISPECIES: hypothetical protein [Geobacter]|uniref:Uncharacterized protein n=1 Tax=Geobacter anodireducens TaxID=1340425 RepID=A0ABR9NZN7_9BACT|nr:MULTISPECIES: hypothetical protein [Geobacter]MBE2889740.1 hypothetical protein [Geobacter anodireducens]
MKKITFTISLLALSASVALAAEPTGLDKTKTGLSLYGLKGTTGTVPTTDQSRIAKSSTGVMLAVTTSAVGYSVATQHVNGTKAYGSAHDSTSIYVKDVTTKGTGESITYKTGKDTFDGVEGWTTM